MSYEKTVWSTGDIVTAEKLNNIENGVEGAGGVEFINQTYDEDDGVYTLDKTHNEISTMVGGGKLPVVVGVGDGLMTIDFITSIGYLEFLSLYTVTTLLGKEYSADSADGILSTGSEPA